MRALAPASSSRAPHAWNVHAHARRSSANYAASRVSGGICHAPRTSPRAQRRRTESARAGGRAPGVGARRRSGSRLSSPGGVYSQQPGALADLPGSSDLLPHRDTGRKRKRRVDAAVDHRAARPPLSRCREDDDMRRRGPRTGTVRDLLPTLLYNSLATVCLPQPSTTITTWKIRSKACAAGDGAAVEMAVARSSSA